MAITRQQYVEALRRERDAVAARPTPHPDEAAHSVQRLADIDEELAKYEAVPVKRGAAETRVRA